jgi:hypothetical protein
VDPCGLLSRRTFFLSALRWRICCSWRLGGILRGKYNRSDCYVSTCRNQPLGSRVLTLKEALWLLPDSTRMDSHRIFWRFLDAHLAHRLVCVWQNRHRAHRLCTTLASRLTASGLEHNMQFSLSSIAYTAGHNSTLYVVYRIQNETTSMDIDFIQPKRERRKNNRQGKDKEL